MKSVMISPINFYSLKSLRDFFINKYSDSSAFFTDVQEVIDAFSTKKETVSPVAAINSRLLPTCPYTNDTSFSIRGDIFFSRYLHTAPLSINISYDTAAGESIADVYDILCVIDKWFVDLKHLETLRGLL